MEDVRPKEEPTAKKPRIAPDTLPGFKHGNQDGNLIYTEENLNEGERIIHSQDCPNILNVQQDVSEIDISQNYSKVVQHLNRGRDEDPDAAEALKEVIKAYEILGFYWSILPLN
jgi:hypothetical protein